MLIRLARRYQALCSPNRCLPMKRKLSQASPSPAPSSPPSPPSKKPPDMAAQATATPPTITLNAREQQLRALLLDAARFIDEQDLVVNQPPAAGQGETVQAEASKDDITKDSSSSNSSSSSSNNNANAPPRERKREPLVLRWAGGWVRDKLLGIDSHDIDTAINAMTGEAFVDGLRAFCDEPARRARHALQADDVGRLHTVPRNPDKSKHLATSTIRLCGLDVDFVNLRRETYAADSRNPAVEFGTAEEDALRRDASVNALFYNLHTGLVEDFTGGLADLRAGLIRTPLEPLQTFLDDPLRVLRLVRFASRLGFRIDEEAERVMADERVLGNLRVKISRERIGVELEKMLKGGFFFFSFPS